MLFLGDFIGIVSTPRREIAGAALQGVQDAPVQRFHGGVLAHRMYEYECAARTHSGTAPSCNNLTRDCIAKSIFWLGFAPSTGCKE